VLLNVLRKEIKSLNLVEIYRSEKLSGLEGAWIESLKTRAVSPGWSVTKTRQRFDHFSFA
jgi:hypothetical protein